MKKKIVIILVIFLVFTVFGILTEVDCHSEFWYFWGNGMQLISLHNTIDEIDDSLFFWIMAMKYV